MNHIFLFVLLAASPILAENAKPSGDFADLRGTEAEYRDFCLTNSSVKLAEVKDIDDIDNLSENVYCFLKCFYVKTGLMDMQGKVVASAIAKLPEVEDFTADEVDELKQCLMKLDDVVDCAGIKHAEICFRNMMDD